MADKGTCEKHKREFELREGCPQCLAERRAAGIRPEQDEMEDGLRSEGLTLIGAKETAAEIIIVCSGGCGKTTEGMTMETRQGEFEQVDESMVPKWTCQECLDKKSQQAETPSAPATETALALRPGEDIEARGYFEEAMKLLEYAEARVITTLEDVKAVNDDLSLISKLKKAMEEKRKVLLDPLKSQADAIRATYDYLMTPISDATKIYKDKMLAYNAEQDRRRLEQEDINRKRMEAAQQEMNLKGEITESVNLVEVTPEPAKSVSTDMGTSGQRDNWTYEVFDFALLPDEYKMVDTSMLNAVAKKHHDQKPVPGVRFINKPIIAVRAR